MAAEISIKPTGFGDDQAVQSLVLAIFHECNSRDVSQQGVNSFYDFMSLEAMAERSKGSVQLAATTNDGVLAGVLEGRPKGSAQLASTTNGFLADVLEGDNSYLTLLFVDKKFHRQGIGRRLLNEFVRITKETDPITLHASRFAVDVYKKLGFVQTGPEFDNFGLPSTPMEMQL